MSEVTLYVSTTVPSPLECAHRCVRFSVVSTPVCTPLRSVYSTLNVSTTTSCASRPWSAPRRTADSVQSSGVFTTVCPVLVRGHDRVSRTMEVCPLRCLALHGRVLSFGVCTPMCPALSYVHDSVHNTPECAQHIHRVHYGVLRLMAVVRTASYCSVYSLIPGLRW